mgnify:FL=1
MRMQESAENYLEAILMLKIKQGYVRSIDVANQLNFSKPSVSVAMKSLRESGYVTVDSDGNLSLTEKGAAIAEKIYERHQVIAHLLIALGVDHDTAYEDSCKIEHDLSDITFRKLKEHYEKHTELS